MCPSGAARPAYRLDPAGVRARAGHSRGRIHGSLLLVQIQRLPDVVVQGIAVNAVDSRELAVSRGVPHPPKQVVPVFKTLALAKAEGDVLPGRDDPGEDLLPGLEDRHSVA